MFILENLKSGKSLPIGGFKWIHTPTPIYESKVFWIFYHLYSGEHSHTHANTVTYYFSGSVELGVDPDKYFSGFFVLPNFICTVAFPS